MLVENNLYPLRISTRLPDSVTGADFAFPCLVDTGGYYYCKHDKAGRLVRATEWICTSLAQHLGIATPQFAVVEDRESGDTLFGSLQISSPASDTELDAFLRTPQFDELGRPAGWLGSYLAGLYAVDLFLGNADRGRSNFLLAREGRMRRLCAFDFAASRLGDLTGVEFALEGTNTLLLGRLLRQRHGFLERASIEMLDRIAAVPGDTIAGILKQMPVDWMGEQDREVTCELWSKDRIGPRLHALRAGIADGTLL